MQLVELDGTRWVTVQDFYEALLDALGAPRWHGANLNALVDSMIYGGINTLEPPYTIQVKGIGNVPADVRTEIELAKQDLAEAREEFRASRGEDIEVRLEIVP
jgi:RNAse (barnase) inhibitor barstar